MPSETMYDWMESFSAAGSSLVLRGILRPRLRAMVVLIALVCLGAAAHAQTAHFSGAIATVGGGFTNPSGVAVDASGYVYVADFGNNAVKKMPAGCASSSCATGLGGGFKEPAGVAVDGSGNVYVADFGDAEVKEIPASCISGDNDSTCVKSLGTSAFSEPYGIAIDGSGNVYVADYGSSEVEEIPASCISGANNSTCVKVLGGGFSKPSGVAVDAGGNVYVGDYRNNEVKEIPASCISRANNSTCVTTLGSGFSEPIGVAVDSSGDVYVGDYGSNAVKEIPASCISGANNSSCMTTLVGTFSYPKGVALDASGNVYVGNSGTNTVPEIMLHAADFNNEAVNSTRSGMTLYFTFDSAGTIGASAAVTQGASNQDFAVVSGGTCTSGTSFSSGNTCTVDVTFTPKFAGLRMGAVNLPNSSETPIATVFAFGVGTGPQLVFETTTTTMLGGGFSSPTGVAVDGSGNIYTVDQNNSNVDVMPAGCTSSSCVTALNGGFFYPQGVAVDGAGNIYVTEIYSSGVKVMPAGCTSPSCVTTLPGNFSGPAGVAVDGGGNVYVADNYVSTIFEIPTGCTDSSCVLSLGGFSSPNAVAVDSSGKIYVADIGNNTVSVMSPSCTSSSCVTTLGGGFSNPTDVKVDGGGNVYVTDQGHNALKIMPAGCTSSGCVTTLASYSNEPPAAVALDGSGNLYLANSGSANLLEFNRATAPSFSFAATDAHQTSSDSPRTLTLLNVGNAALIFPLSMFGTGSNPTGNNPSISANFSLGSGSCPQLNLFSTSAGTLAGGASCTLPVNFTPGIAEGAITGTLVLTDNTLNVANTTQTIALSGTGLGTLAATVAVSSEVLTVGQPNVNTTPVVGSGGMGTLTFTISPSTLPAGLSFNSSNGAITGVPAAATTTMVGNLTVVHSVSYTVSVTDADNITDTGTFSLTVNYPVTTTVDIASTLIYVNEAGISFTPVTGSGGTGTLTYGIAPSVPAGLSFNSSNGAISGEATAVSPTTVYTITVTDTNGASSSSTFTLTVNPTPPTPVNFGSVAVGASATQSMTFTVNATGMLGSPQVVTMGATGLDFTDSGTGTCTTTHSYNPGDTCTVVVAFAPIVPGLRNGAVNLLNSSGVVIASGYVYGVGTGPQVVYGNSSTTNVYSSILAGINDVAVDASGNIYTAYTGDANYGVVTMQSPTCASPSCVLQLGGTTNNPESVAVDGAGNVFIGGRQGYDNGSGYVEKMPPGCTSSSCVTLLVSNVTSVASVVIDSVGDAYVASGVKVLFIPAGCQIKSCISTIADDSVIAYPIEGLGLDAAGNLYVAAATPDSGSPYDEGTPALIIIPAGCKSDSCVKPLITGVIAGNILGHLAVDADGDIYFTPGWVIEVAPAGCTSPSCVRTLPDSGVVSDLTTVALDGSGNIYYGTENYGSPVVSVLNRSTAPTLTFPVTGVGQTPSTATTTLMNIGNTALTLSSDLSITNPVFTLDKSTTCPTSASGTLAASVTCNLTVDFAPQSATIDTGSLVATDNALNVPNTTQTIPLNGTGVPVAAKLAFGNPPPATIAVNGTPGTITVLEEDANGNVIPSLSDGILLSFTATNGGTDPVSSMETTAVNGVASFQIGPSFTSTPGTYTYTATVCSNCGNLYDSATPAVAVETVTPPTASFGTLSLSPGATEPQGTSVPVTISDTVIYNGVQPTGAVTFTLNGVGYTATCTSTGSPETCSATVPAATIAALTRNSYTVTAALASDSVYAAATGASGTFTVTYPISYSAPTEPIGTTSATQTATIEFDSTFTVGSVNVLTLGVTGLDYIATGGTCAHGFSATPGATCTVTYTFTPRFAGARNGAITLQDGSGNTQATVYLNGTGTGPQAVFNAPLTTAALGGGFHGPYNLAADGSGNVYVADAFNNAVKEIPSGCTTSSCVLTLVDGLGALGGLAMDGGGNVYVTDDNAVKQIPLGCTSSSCVTTLGGGFDNPHGVAVDGSGNVYVSDTFNLAIKVMPSGCASASCVTTLTTTALLPSYIAVDGSGNVYFDVGSYGTQQISEIPVGCASSSCVTAVGDGFISPNGIAVDASGNIYVADQNDNALKVMAAGCTSSSCVTTLATGLSIPTGVALDGGGNVYVVDTLNNTVSKLDRVDGPSLTFATATPVGSTDTTDGAQTVTLANIGTTALTLSSLTAGDTNANFSGAATTCATGTPLAAGASCNLGVVFAPTAVSNPLTGSAVVTDNSLNNPAATQMVAISGVSTALMATFGTLSLSPAATEPQGTSVAVTISDTLTYGYTQPAGAVTFTLNGVGYTATCTSTGSPETCSATVPAATIAALGVNSYTVTAALAADSVYTATTGTSGTFTITAPTEPALSFTVPTHHTIDAPFTVSAVSNSPGAISYSLVSGPASVSGSTVTLTGAGGTVVLTASQAASGGYTAASINASFSVVAGSVWLGNPGGSVSIFGSDGVALENATGAGVGTISTPLAEAFDSAGKLWVASANGVSAFTKNGTAVQSTAFTGGGIASPVSLAVDGAGQVWVANGNSTVSVLSNTGAAISPGTGYPATAAGTPGGLAVDLSGNVWVTNQTANTVTEILGAATPAAPASTALANGTTGAKP